MKTVEISKATKPLSDYVGRVNLGAVLVVKNGKPIAVLSSVEGMDAESIALANNPKFAEILRRSREQYDAEGGITVDEMRRQLRLKKRTTRKRGGSV